VHPGNLFAAYEQMSAAEAELQAIEEELYEQLKMKFAKKMINEKLPKRDQDSVKPEDLEIAIKRLQQRHESIETLEKLLLGQGNLENLEKLVLGQSNVMDAQSQFSKTVKQFFCWGLRWLRVSNGGGPYRSREDPYADRENHFWGRRS